MGDLKACPFCGASAKVATGLGEAWVLCDGCGQSGGFCAGEADAIATWNRRAEPKAPDAAEVVVPREPTEAMLRAGGTCQPFMTKPDEKPWRPGQITAAAVYRAMIAAARAGEAGQPSPPSLVDQEGVREALKLAANRLARLALELPHGSALRYEATEWAEQALAVMSPRIEPDQGALREQEARSVPTATAADTNSHPQNGDAG